MRLGVQLLGLDQFAEVFLISGTITETTTKERKILSAPRKLPTAFREVEVTAGQPAIFDEVSSYDEYARLQEHSTKRSRLNSCECYQKCLYFAV